MKSKNKRIYLIGSLANKKIPLVGNELRKAGFDVFDSWFSPGPHADEYWRQYTKTRGMGYKEALADYSAQHVFEFDKHHIDTSDIGVMLMPAGKSGHLELGYMIGCGKKGYILFDKEPKRYDVMTLFATDIFFDIKDLIKELQKD
jgi:nucleoside 2-deoxyribosyltransferase